MSDLNNKSVYRNELLDILIPDLPEEGNLQMPTPGVLSYYKDRKDRIIWINKDIDDSLFDEIKLILSKQFCKLFLFTLILVSQFSGITLE